MVHVGRRAGGLRDSAPTALPDELGQVVDARHDAVQEQVEMLIPHVVQLAQRHERAVAHLCEMLDAGVERATRAFLRAMRRDGGEEIKHAGALVERG